MRTMDTGVYIRKTHGGVALVAGAEVIDDWGDGCRIRSEEELESSPDVVYYIVEGEQLVAVKFSASDAETAPFDYAADKDRSDARVLAGVTI